MTLPRLGGRLLVASPALPDPNFDRTVVLVLQHDDDGAMGLVLNRPLSTTVAELLPRWGRLAGEPPVIFKGGPVAPNAVICLARPESEAMAEGYIPLFPGVGTVNLEESVGAGIAEIRPFAGYAGWSPGQLEQEVAARAWFICSTLPGDPFSPEPATLWRRVLQRHGGSLAIVSLYPDDIDSN